MIRTIRRNAQTICVLATLLCATVSCKDQPQERPRQPCDALCAERECGTDPICEVDCGSCNAGTCSDDGQCTDVEPGCGNDVLEPGELCDGSQLGSSTCLSQGYSGGILSCTSTCDGFDTSGCTNETCTPDCSGRECGPDPLCGESCGTCTPGSCENGACVEVSEDAPVIVQFTSNQVDLDQNGTLLLSAIVTDPQGVDDVIGGTLESPNGALYASFATSASEGAYSATLTWPVIHQVEPLSFEESRELILIAKFFDQAANAVTAEIRVTLRCADSDEDACDAQCFNRQTDASHCGACDRMCADGGSCQGGECQCAEDEDCQPATLCRAGICVPGCRADHDCPDAAFCSDGSCLDGCRGDASCAEDELCDKVSRQCRSGCNLDATALQNDHWIGSFNVDFADLYFLEEATSYQDHLYVSEGEDVIAIIDASNPSAPSYAGTLTPSAYLRGLQVHNATLWGLGSGAIHRYDLTQPANPVLVERLLLPNNWDAPRARAYDRHADGTIAAVVSEDDGSTYTWTLRFYESQNTPATMVREIPLPPTSQLQDAMVAVGSAATYVYREDQTVLWVVRRDQPTELQSYSLTEAPRLLAALDTALYLESESDTGIYNLESGSVLNLRAQIPHGRARSVEFMGSHVIRSLGSAGFDIVNLESLETPFVQQRIDSGQSVFDVAVVNSSLWLAEQPETIRRVALPGCLVD